MKEKWDKILSDVRLLGRDEKIMLLQRIEEKTTDNANVPVIVKELLSDEDAEVRKHAVYCAWDIAELMFLPSLLRMARSDPNSEVRAECCAALGAYVFDGAVMGEMPNDLYNRVWDVLYRIATDEDEEPAIRCVALESLAFEDSQTVSRLIAKFYNAGRKDFRCAALIGMGRSGSNRWLSILLQSVLSEDVEIARAAIQACGEAGYDEATLRLRNLVFHGPKENRIAAIEALSSCGGLGAEETLELCAESKDREIARAARDALRELELSRERDEYEAWDEGAEWGE